MVMLQRWSVSWRENNVMEAGLMAGACSCYIGGQFNGGRMLQVVTLMMGDWSCYSNHQFNGGRMVMLRRWAV